jgi:hypothetical protein
MRKIECVLETGYVGGTRKGVIEVEDDATDSEIDEAVNDWAHKYLSWGWSEAPADAEVTD